jgi:prepilin-type N-terminal cleavage/methylation domain-containing protein
MPSSKRSGIGLWYDVKNPQVSAPPVIKLARSAIRRGFTIIEVMIGMVILLLVVTSVFAVVPATVAFGSESQIRMQATGAAQDYLDVIRQYIKTNGVDTNLPQAPVIPIEQGAASFSGLARPSLGNFEESASCTERSLFTFDCLVTVSWRESGSVRSVEVESYIASQAGF